MREIAIQTYQKTSIEKDFEKMINQLTELQNDLINCWKEVETKLENVEKKALDSSRNLVYYLALRRHDIRKLQNELARYGFSSLGRSESYVMMNINKILKSLHKILQYPLYLPPECENELNLDEGQLILKKNTDRLLGKEPKHRKVRIMVTLPGEAALNYGLVLDLIKNGMNVARINCAHDGQAEWEQMVENIKRARKEAKRDCKICLDIAGPKLRSGFLEEGPRVLKIRPSKDVFGRVTQPSLIWLTTAENPEPSPSAPTARLNFPKDFLQQFQTGNKIRFKDARGSNRTLTVKEAVGNSFWAECERTAYISPETEFKIANLKPSRKAKPDNISPLKQFVSLQKGSLLVLTKDQTPGKPAKLGNNGKPIEPARVPCTLAEVFDDVKAGEKIWFDDGKIGGVIKSVSSDEILVEIRRAGAKVQKLRADKGINLPDSNLRFPSLTAKDLTDLEFIVRHADIIGYSFVRCADDVVQLQKKLKELKGDRLGIILKIETRRAFEQLPEILLTAMSSPSFGVMIARGDLAIETGFERLAEVQEEILWMCEAAHIPVIWATQVLEGLSKSGVYSRAEITDAAMSERAECVMLNKGLFIVEAVRTLDNILTRMQSHQDKKRSMFRHLHLADNFFAPQKQQNN
jgi:pyruvate kinase